MAGLVPNGTGLPELAIMCLHERSCWLAREGAMGGGGQDCSSLDLGLNSPDLGLNCNDISYPE